MSYQNFGDHKSAGFPDYSRGAIPEKARAMEALREYWDQTDGVKKEK